MSSKVQVQFTPLYGVHGQQPLCYLLQIDDCRLLLDCGWTEEFEPGILGALRSVAGTVDGVVVSHASIAHCGALPQLYGRMGCTAPLYMTMPVNRLGPLVLQDAYYSKRADEGDTDEEDAEAAAVAAALASTAAATPGLLSLSLSRTNARETFAMRAFSMDDISRAFTLTSFGGPAVQLRFGEEVVVKGVTLVPAGAGNSLGAAIWAITKGAETLLYAVDFNHKNERHLNKAKLTALFNAPSALIVDAASGNELVKDKDGSSGSGSGSSAEAALTAVHPSDPEAHKKDKDAVARDLVDACLASLRSGGNVLLPTDTAGRALELLLRLDAAFANDHPYPVFFLSRVSHTVIEYAKTLLEYMNEKLTRAFTDLRRVPFAFPPERSRVRIVTSLEPIQAAMRAGPVVVISSFASLQMGFARQLFVNWAADSNSSIIFTSQHLAPPGSLAAQLLASPPPQTVAVETWKAELLSGTELRKWREAKEDEKRKAARIAAAARAKAAEEAELADTAAAIAASGGALKAEGGDVMVDAEGAEVGVAAAVPSSSPARSRSAGAGAGAAGGMASPAGFAMSDGADDDGYSDDEEAVMASAYADDALSFALAGGLAGRGGSSGVSGIGPGGSGLVSPTLSRGPSGTMAVGRGNYYKKGLTARFPMFNRDEGLRSRDGGLAATAATATAADASRGGAGVGELTEYGYGIDAEAYVETFEARAAAEAERARESGRDRDRRRGERYGDRDRDRDRDRYGDRDRDRYGDRDRDRYGDRDRDDDRYRRDGDMLPSSNGGAGGDKAAGDKAPTKRVKSVTSVRVAARIRYIPLEGRVDATSLLHIIEAIAPLKVLLVHGSREGTEALAAAARPYTSLVLTPAVAQSVDLSSGIAEHTLALRDSLFNNVPLRRVGLHDAGYVHAEVTLGGSLAVGGGGSGGGEGEGEAGQALLLSTYPGPPPGHTPVLLRPGPVRLADVRKHLLAVAGLESEVYEGCLVTSGGILIASRPPAPGALSILPDPDAADAGEGGEGDAEEGKEGKDGMEGDEDDEEDAVVAATAARKAAAAASASAAGPGGNAAAGFMLTVEGPVCDEYYTVRRAIYSMYTMV